MHKRTSACLVALLLTVALALVALSSRHFSNKPVEIGVAAGKVFQYFSEVNEKEEEEEEEEEEVEDAEGEIKVPAGSTYVEALIAEHKKNFLSPTVAPTPAPFIPIDPNDPRFTSPPPPPPVAPTTVEERQKHIYWDPPRIMRWDPPGWFLKTPPSAAGPSKASRRLLFEPHDHTDLYSVRSPLLSRRGATTEKEQTAHHR
jgi:hypothetical protein